MQNLRTSSNKGCNDVYDVSVSLTYTDKVVDETVSVRFKLHCRNWIGGRRRGTNRRKTIFFTPQDLFNSDADEAESITVQILRNQEKSSIKFIGELNRMQCFGLTCPQHKMLFWNFGKLVLVPLLRTILFPKNASSTSRTT